mgnify:CR=1 FL=1
MLSKIIKHQFLFEELVKRDFKKKYKRTIIPRTILYQPNAWKSCFLI